MNCLDRPINGLVSCKKDWAINTTTWVVTAVNHKGNNALGGFDLKGYCGIAMLRGISVYVDVLQSGAVSMEQYIAEVEQFGGKVIFPRKELPGTGYYAIYTDTENNGFAIW